MALTAATNGNGNYSLVIALCATLSLYFSLSLLLSVVHNVHSQRVCSASLLLSQLSFLLSEAPVSLCVFTLFRPFEFNAIQKPLPHPPLLHPESPPLQLELKPPPPPPKLLPNPPPPLLSPMESEPPKPAGFTPERQPLVDDEK